MRSNPNYEYTRTFYKKHGKTVTIYYHDSSPENHAKTILDLSNKTNAVYCESLYHNQMNMNVFYNTYKDRKYELGNLLYDKILNHPCAFAIYNMLYFVQHQNIFKGFLGDTYSYEIVSSICSIPNIIYRILLADNQDYPDLFQLVKQNVMKTINFSNYIHTETNKELLINNREFKDFINKLDKTFLILKKYSKIGLIREHIVSMINQSAGYLDYMVNKFKGISMPSNSVLKPSFDISILFCLMVGVLVDKTNISHILIDQKNMNIIEELMLNQNFVKIPDIYTKDGLEFVGYTSI